MVKKYSERSLIVIFLIAVFLRMFNDTFASGIFFVVTLKNTNESTAALVLSFSLLLTFVFSPMIGYFIDKKIFLPKTIAILYTISGLAMVLFLIKEVSLELSIFINLILISFTTIPTILFFNVISTLIKKGKPASGYGIYAMINTLGAILGGITGALFVTTDESLIMWVSAKMGLSISIGIGFIIIINYFVIFIKESTSPEAEIITPVVAASNALKTRGLIFQTQAIFSISDEQTEKTAIHKKNFIPKISKLNLFMTVNHSWRKKIFLLATTIFIITLIRAFILVIVAFNIFHILNNDVLTYTAVTNLAALTTLVFFPIIGRIVDRLGTWNCLVFGILIHTLYLASFLILTSEVAILILWVLPVWMIIEISELGLIAEIFNLKQRSTSIGVINGAISLGSMVGAYLITVFFATIYEEFITSIFILAPMIIVILLIPLRNINNNKEQPAIN